MTEPRTAIVTGASRGFGRAIATHLVRRGVTVFGIARDQRALDAVRDNFADMGKRFVPLAGDAADPELARHALEAHRPEVVVLAAGATPTMRPLHEQTWESFGAAWDLDVRQTFHWCSQALLAPLAEGSTVIAFSSGAALQGSPLSGGYAGAKSTVRFITSYAADESARGGLGIRFTCVLPKLTPVTDLGAVGVAGYAARDGMGVDAYLETFGPVSTAEAVAADVVTLALDASYDSSAYRLPPTGGLVAL